MPDILQDLLPQKCVYWPQDSINQYGKATPGTAVERNCRWEDKQQDRVDSQGRTYVSRATVYLKKAVELNGWLWLGKLVNKPSSPPSKYIIREVEEMKDVEGDETIWIARL